MKIMDFHSKHKDKTFSCLLRWLWKLEENEKGVKDIIKYFLSDNNPFWKIKYFERWRWKKIENFDFKIDVINNSSNGLWFYWELKNGWLYSFGFNLEDRFIWKWWNKKLYRCSKVLQMFIYDETVGDDLLLDCYTFMNSKFKPTYGVSSWIHESVLHVTNIYNEYIIGKRAPNINTAGMVAYLWPFIFKNILNRQEFIKKMSPFAYKLEEQESGWILIQVNKKDPFNLTLEENREKYIKYLKELNLLLPGWSNQTLYYLKEEIDRHGALDWWFYLTNYIKKWWKEWYEDIAKYIPEVLDENWNLKISEEDQKLLWQWPVSNYNYIVE